MQVLLDENGFVVAYAIIGDLNGGIKVPDPEDIDHFESHFPAYLVRDGTATFDNERNTLLEQEQLKEAFRQRREQECFSVINRGQLWYESITLPQLLELRASTHSELGNRIGCSPHRRILRSRLPTRFPCTVAATLGSNRTQSRHTGKRTLV